MNASLSIVLALSASAAIIGAHLVQRGLLAHRYRQAIDRRLEGFAGDSSHETLGELGPIEAAIASVARLSLLVSKDLQAQARLIRAAGIFAPGAVDRFLALRVVLAAIAAVSGFMLGTMADYPPVVVAALMAVLVPAGYACPAFLLQYLAAKRRKRITRELPLFLDSVKLLLQTGAGLELALRQTARMETAAIPELRRTLEYLLQDLDLGKSYDLAFERWVEKAAVPGAEEFAGLALQSIKHGSELTPMLEQFIEDLIEQRLAMARELAGKRSVSLTVVMVAFFLPPLIMIIAAPAVVEIVRVFLQ